MTDRTDAKSIMKRVEALVMTASLNASNQGGDAATAAADLMCAFTLISMRAGAEPKEARKAMEDHAIATCTDFWGSTGRCLDG